MKFFYFLPYLDVDSDNNRKTERFYSEIYFLTLENVCGKPSKFF